LRPCIFKSIFYQFGYCIGNKYARVGKYRCFSLLKGVFAGMVKIIKEEEQVLSILFPFVKIKNPQNNSSKLFEEPGCKISEKAPLKKECPIRGYLFVAFD
jgi:hypothetical protein